LKLNDITAQIRDDLAAVEERLKLIGQVESPWLAELLDYSLRGGGKRIRPILSLLCGKLYDYSLERLMPMAMAVELMHLATLVHDDTIDRSSVRWGRPTVNSLWGDDQAVLLGDYLFAQAGELVATTDNLRVIKLLPQTLMVISSGEIEQSRTAFSLEQTRQSYLHLISSKTASLFTLATQSGAILSGAPEQSVRILREYGHNLGIAFQIVDDILDFIGTEEEMGKPVGSDLAQGHLTLPAQLFLERCPEGNPVRELFQAKEGEHLVQQAISQVRDSPIIDECFRVAGEYSKRACEQLDRLPSCEGRQALFDLAAFIISRRR
jgi:geranylgeranyl pyrophosphate synthase